MVGDSDFVTNAYFDQVANGELGVAMIRWLARDDVLPTVRPERSTPPMVAMTAHADALDLHRARASAAAQRRHDRIGGLVAAPLTGRGGQTAAALAGGMLAAALLIALAVTGSAPKLASFEPFVPAGVMARVPEEITRIELRAGPQVLVFARIEPWVAQR